jgi:hypothetical protein
VALLTSVLFALLVALTGCDPKWEISEDYDGDGFTVADGDCDDLNDAVGPGAAEIWYDGFDQDCAGDDDYDQDGDGVAAAEGAADGAPVDCDDTDPDVYPGAPDASYDGVDSDCDDAGEYDADGDGFDATEAGGTDCDDTDPDVYPGAADAWYDGVDSDCAGDDDYDQDGDGDTSADYGGGDCDDTDAAVGPGAAEIWYDGIDQDCDGNDADRDGDGFQSADVEGGDDCDDTDDGVYPGAEDTPYDGVDSDCGGGSDYDADGDGYESSDYGGNDCDDTSDIISPGEVEDCTTAWDDNCDGDTNNVNAIACVFFYADGDSDGYGGGTGRCYCAATEAYAYASADDCDDGDEAINPAADEICDEADTDEDCDGVADDDDSSVVGVFTLVYPDADLDGYGDADGALVGFCDPGAGYAADNTDCDDTRDDVNPGEQEVCDEDDTDEDCSGSADDDDPGVLSASEGTWYPDGDSDGYGDQDDAGARACDASAAYSTQDSSDCDDGDEAIYPGADEVCDGADNNCDGEVDEVGAIDGVLYYVDVDGDGYGDEDDEGVRYCADPGDGSVTNNGDCDDRPLGGAAVNPAATEVCDEDDTDEDCDGLVDDADGSVSGQSTWYLDLDGDGYGDALDGGTLYCDPGGEVVEDNTDCDDDDADVNPDADELCDAFNTDEDCDGFADDEDPEFALGGSALYPDLDSDGYGDADGAPVSFCDEVTGYAADATDCDDTRDDVNPGAQEVCDADDTDEDCDGFADDQDGDGATGKVTRYDDSDSDGYGDEDDPGTDYCDPPDDVVADNTDCDDSRDTVNPGADEVCDSLDRDEDCDGFSDDDDPEGAGGAAIAYVDEDRDGYGVDDGAEVRFCELPVGYSEVDGDCDDTNAGANPGAQEVCDDEDVDEDCDGSADSADPEGASGEQLWYADADSDGYGDEDDAGQLACDPPADTVGDNTDCDDSASGVNPGAQEVCDAADTDEDCDGRADDSDFSASGKVTWYADDDSDGYGDGDDAGTDYCDPPSGVVSDNTDCDDSDAGVNPGETEVCDAADTDEDCNGVADDDDAGVDAGTLSVLYPDSDGDGFGDEDSAGASLCDANLTYRVADHTDCDDSRGDVNPDADEICDVDDTDEDCDGFADDDDDFALGGSAWYPDLDGDGYGDVDGSPISSCDEIADYATDSTDCDDDDAAINPGADEVCDAFNTDEDCSGSADDDDPGVVGRVVYYTDADLDGYGDALDEGSEYCDPLAATSTDNTDCDDDDSGTNPGETEVYDDDTDQDCDGYAPYYVTSLSPGDLVVSEVMMDPSAALDADGEWFEVLNVSGVDVDLDGLIVYDLGTNSATLSETTLISAGQAVVFGVNADSDVNGGVDVDVEISSGLTLANGGDELILSNGIEDLDEVDWNGWDLPPGGQSLSLDPAALDNSGEGAWCGATGTFGEGDYGSPGEANPDCLSHDDDIQPIWDAECISCHGDISPSAGLDLEGDARASLVEVTETGSGLYFVEPYAPEDSYLWHKLEGTFGDVGGSGSQMPLGSAPLDDADLDAVETWILQGAHE